MAASGAAPWTASFGPAHAQPPATVFTDTVRESPLAQTIPVIGRLVPREISIVAALIGAPVAEVLVREGDRVARGAVLARLSTPRLAAQRALAAAELEEGTAELAAAEANLALSQQEFERIAGLRGSSAFSQARYDEAAETLNRARSLVGVAESRQVALDAALDLAEIDLGHATIEAPIPGVISERYANAGEYVTIAAPIVTIIDDTELEIEAAVPTDRIAGLTPGRAIDVLLDDGTTHAAEVRASVPLEDTRTRTRVVRFVLEFGETAKPLAGNQSVTVYVPAGPATTVVTVHKDAVIVGPDGRIVYVVEDGAVAIRPVTLGLSVGDRFEVLQGLSPGDVVVVRGNERLIPGQPVSAMPVDAPSPAPADAAPAMGDAGGEGTGAGG